MMTVLLGVVGFVAITLLAVNVSRDLKLLDSATSDNVQWTLSQTEVEFLELQILLDASSHNTVSDLTLLRRDFDIFYSRIQTLSEASVYAPVRDVIVFSRNLKIIQTYLNDAVPVIDANDAELFAALPALSAKTTEVRKNVRMLSNGGLNFFANESDRRRENVFDTLFQLAVGVAVLLLTLLIFALYLGRLNNQNIRRRRQAIHASKRMNVVTSTALDAVVVADMDGRILDFNAAAVQIFGYSAEDAIGSTLSELIVPDHHREAHAAGMKRMREKGEKRVVGKGRIKLDAKRADGELFPVEFAVQSAETDEGEIFISFLRDISQAVAVEKDLLAARDRALAGEKAKTDFLATMSHEIRTPLNGLLGNLSLLKDTSLNAKQSQYIKNMDTSGKLLMSHISDVLDITKYDAGKLQLRPVVMNLSTLLQDIVDSQSGAASAKNTILSWGWTGISCDWISADNERIQHVLMNIIGNAVKFTRDGEITVDATVLGDIAVSPEIQITVRDTGVGMSETLRLQVFDDFMTGDASYDRDVGGTGLGLGIALRFVKAMGGTIDVQSEEGKGSTFVIHFPIEPVDASSETPYIVERAELKKSAHILLVEDNEINRMVAREMMKAQGHKVTEAHNGKVAVELTATEHFDMIFMDISMPVMDGRAATRAIRASNGPSSKVPIVALTANAVSEEQEAFLSDGMNDILTKPLSREGLIDVISQFSGQSSTEYAPPTATTVFVDLEHLNEMRETLGVNGLNSLLERFRTEMDEAVQVFGTNRSTEEMAQHAHKISGSAATFGAVELHSVLTKIEGAAKRSDPLALSEAVDILPKIWFATQPFLKVE